VRDLFRSSIVVLAALWTLGVSSVSAQRPPTIAAAANLNFALTEIAKQFERDRGARVEVVFGASGMLTRQIRDGAPFEMFLAADEEFPSQLTAAGGLRSRTLMSLRTDAPPKPHCESTGSGTGSAPGSFSATASRKRLNTRRPATLSAD